MELLAEAPTRLTISEMMVLLGLKTISEIFRIVMVMEAKGWISKAKGSDEYRVTHKVMDLVFSAIPSFDLAQYSLV